MHISQVVIRLISYKSPSISIMSDFKIPPAVLRIPFYIENVGQLSHLEVKIAAGHVGVDRALESRDLYILAIRTTQLMALLTGKNPDLI